MRLALALLLGTGCGLVLDFESVDDLPCDCLPDYVCLVQSDRCVKRHSVENFKSCTPDALDPDALCPVGSICVARGGKGPRCLPRCTPRNYTTPESGAAIAAQCPATTTCWGDTGGRGGVCDEGECEDNPNTCDGGRRCAKFNGAGVCFTRCDIFQGDGGCAGNQSCHPISDTSVTSCVEAGQRERGQVCGDTDPCRKFDTSTGPMRPMVCDKPMSSGDQRRCWATCKFSPVSGGTGCHPTEACLLARANVDPSTGDGLGLCVRN